MAVVLLLFALVVPLGWWAAPLAFLVPVLGSILVVNLQLRLMHVAGEAQTLRAALNHASLNVANALGAWLGGSVIAAGLGYRAPAVVGAALCLVGSWCWGARRRCTAVTPPGAPCRRRRRRRAVPVD
jgi:MFS transporter, DHA1 family, inner membrane transport protein